MAPDYPEDRRYDQLLFEKDLAERSEGFYDAIRAKDDSKVRWILGVPPAGSGETGEEADVSERSSTPPTVDEQFAEHSSKLTAALKYSRTLPAAVREEWMRKAGEIDLYEPTKGLVVLEDLFARFELASNRYEPRPNIWNMDVGPIMNFVDQMCQIEWELKWLRDLLKHVELYLDNTRRLGVGASTENRNGHCQRRSD
jgi:hypothetical protein